MLGFNKLGNQKPKVDAELESFRSKNVLQSGDFYDLLPSSFKVPYIYWINQRSALTTMIPPPLIVITVAATGHPLTDTLTH